MPPESPTEQHHPDAPAHPIQFAGATLDVYRHVCAFFHSLEEEYQVLLPFITDGFARGSGPFILWILGSVTPTCGAWRRSALM